MLGHVEQLDEQAQAVELHEQHHHRGYQQRSEDGVDQRALADEQQRPGLDAVDQKAAEQDRRGGVAGDAQGHQRHHGAADAGVVGGLAGDHAADVALAIGCRLLGALLRDDVGQQVGGAGADARQDAHRQADQARAAGVGQLLAELPEREAEALDVLHAHRADLAARGVPPGFGELDDLGDGEHADHHREHGEAAVQFAEAEGEAAHRLHRGDADGGHGDAEGAGEQPLDHRAGRQGGDQRQGEHRDGEVFVRAEAQRHLGQLRGDEHQRDDAEDGAEKGEHDADAERLHAQALLHQRAAVEHRGDGRWCAGNLQQDRRDQAAGCGADEQGDQQRQAGLRTHGEGQRQAKGDRHGRGQTGHGAEHDADGDAEKHQDQDVEREDGTEALLQ